MITMTEQQYCDLQNQGDVGFCFNCEAMQTGCEPDARNYVCEACELPQVFGLEELLMMNQIKLVEETLKDRKPKRKEAED